MGKNRKSKQYPLQRNKKVVIQDKDKKIQKGVIGIPHMGTFPWQTSMSFQSLRFPADTMIQYHYIGSCLIYDARDKLIEFAIEEKADWLMMIDSDMVVPNDALIKFANTVLEGKPLDMVSGMAFKRTPPFQPCFYTKARINPETKKHELESPIDFPDSGLLPVEGFGMACTFMRMEAVKKIKQEINGKPTWFFPLPGVGEDLSFCIRARMAGIKMYTDLSVNVGHVATMVVSKEHFIMARNDHMKNKPDEQLFKEEASNGL